MSQIIITADIHAGVPGKHDDVMWALRTQSAYAKKHNIDTIFVLGDLVHDRKTIDYLVLCDIYNFFRTERQEGRQWIVFPGNHDMYMRHSWDVNVLLPLESVITYVETVTTIMTDNLRWWVIPFIQLESSYMSVLEAVAAKAGPDDCLMTHIGINNALKNICFLLTEWNIVHFANTPFKRIYSGHFHCYQEVDKRIWYPGSPIPHKADEGDCHHGFLVFDTEKVEHVFVDSWQAAEELGVEPPESGVPAQYWTIALEDIASVSDDMIQNNIVRLGASHDYSEHEKSKIEAVLVERGARKVRWLNLAKDEEAPILSPRATDDKNELFTHYLASDDKETKGLNTGLLTRLHHEVSIEADDRYYLNTIDEIES